MTKKDQQERDQDPGECAVMKAKDIFLRRASQSCIQCSEGVSKVRAE